MPSPSPSKVKTPWDCSPLPGCTCHLVLKTLGFPVNIFPHLHAPSSTFFSTKGIGLYISFLLPLWKIAINFLHLVKLPKISANKIPHLISKGVYLNIQRYIKNSYNSNQKEKTLTIWLKKWAKELISHFPKGDIQIAKRHMKRGST